MPECAYHPSSSGGDNACSNATSGYTCITAAGQPGIPYRTFLSQGAAVWLRQGDLCLGDKEKPLSLDAILAQVRVLADQLIPVAPQLTVQPPGGIAITQLPTLMRADGPTTTTKTFFLNVGAPVTVAVHAATTGWTWNVDGQPTLTTDFPGRAYQDGHSPRTEPGYYAAHTFTTTGTAQLTVTTSWTATATFPGLGTYPVTGAIARTSAPVGVTIKQARAQLEAPPS